jgi:hypothetical protein
VTNLSAGSMSCFTKTNSQGQYACDGVEKVPSFGQQLGLPGSAGRVVVALPPWCSAAGMSAELIHVLRREEHELVESCRSVADAFTETTHTAGDPLVAANSAR